MSNVYRGGNPKRENPSHSQPIRRGKPQDGKPQSANAKQRGLKSRVQITVKMYVSFLVRPAGEQTVFNARLVVVLQAKCQKGDELNVFFFNVLESPSMVYQYECFSYVFGRIWLQSHDRSGSRVGLSEYGQPCDYRQSE